MWRVGPVRNRDPPSRRNPTTNQADLSWAVKLSASYSRTPCQASAPPSIVNVAPVMKAASSEAR